MKQIEKECRDWGIGMIAAAALSFMLTYLDIFTGCIALIIGLITLISRQKWNLAMIGCFIILVGSLNILGGILLSSFGWALWGGVQILIGVDTINKYHGNS